MPLGSYVGAATGRPQVDVFIPELWSSEILRFRDANFVVSQFLKKIPMVGKKGDLVHIPEISRLAVNNKVYNTPVTLQTRTEGEYTIIIDQYKEVSFESAI